MESYENGSIDKVLHCKINAFKRIYKSYETVRLFLKMNVDGCIHRAAGSELFEECKLLSECEAGSAKITKGYNLSCIYVIHAVGQRWMAGNIRENNH